MVLSSIPTVAGHARPVAATRPTPPIAAAPEPLAGIGGPSATHDGVTVPAPAPLAAMPEPPSPAAAPPIRTLTLRLDGMIDRDVIGIDGGDIGHVIDVLVDRGGSPQAVLVETNGFLGVGDRKIAVAWSALSFGVRSGARPVVVDMTVDQVRGAPAFVGGGAAEVAAGPLEVAPAVEPPPVAASPAAVDDSATGSEIAPYPAPLASPHIASRR